jgi:hypothetical protein
MERRERELTHQLAALRSEIESKEAELAEVVKARSAIGSHQASEKPLGYVAGDHFQLPGDEGADLVATDAQGKRVAIVQFKSSPGAVELSIKQLAVKALWEGFRNAHATQSELREFIKNAYGRQVDRASLSPQLSRLKAEGIVRQSNNDRWQLVPDGGDTLRGAGVIPSHARLDPAQRKKADESGM